MENETSKIGSESYKVYLLVWASLVVLTVTTIYVASIDLGRFGVTVNILIASLKAGLVVQIFMHLKNESRFLKIMLLMALLSLTVIIILTFLDILYR